jgi:pilus assembly protein CpaB
MGKWKAIIPIVLALVFATTASIFVYKWLQTKTTPKEVVRVESEAVPVSVAALDLPWGTKLEPEMIETVPYLKESLPPGYSSKPESLKGRVLISAMKRNEPIVEYRLAPPSVSTGGVSAVVTAGKRALAVKGDKVIGISGFIRPADRVDVLVTLTDQKNKRETTTKIVLQDVPVLATGTEIIENGEGGKPHPVDVYTLEVTPEDGEKLALAATQGKLQFALRNVTDKETVLTKGATIRGALASFRPKEQRRSAKGNVTNRTFTVEVIKGGKVNKIKVKS